VIGPFPEEHLVRSAYTRRFEKLGRVAKALHREIELQVSHEPEVALVQARAKGIDEFVAKAMRPKDWHEMKLKATRPRRRLAGSVERKYRYPLEEIQDQIGCRVVVKSHKARKGIALLLAAHFGHLEKGYKIDKDPRVFGYAGHHVVCPIPEPLRAKYKLPTQAFEIQVATLFQFAWSQMEHAVGYKPAGVPLTREQRRNLAAAAALAETADGLFSRVRETAPIGAR
jgi:ppGpp synthetase/RelA/SpoT-type nucleotidyltranferase